MRNFFDGRNSDPPLGGNAGFRAAGFDFSVAGHAGDGAVARLFRGSQNVAIYGGIAVFVNRIFKRASMPKLYLQQGVTGRILLAFALFFMSAAAMANNLPEEREDCDNPKAYEYLKEEVDKGNVGAHVGLATLYREGQCVQQDLAKAVRLYRKAAERGDADAQYYLGVAYADGSGVRQDHARAAQWFARAAKRKHPAALVALGDMYAGGTGVRKDDAKARALYARAAELSYAGAMYRLGVIYDRGQGVQPDREKAISWYSRASDMGDWGAYNRLKEMEKEEEREKQEKK